MTRKRAMSKLDILKWFIKYTLIFILQFMIKGLILAPEYIPFS